MDESDREREPHLNDALLIYKASTSNGAACEIISNEHPSKSEEKIGDCGIGCMKLPCLKMFVSVKTFIFLYFAFAFLNGFQNSYTIAVLTTLERRFDLPSSLSGMLVTTSTVGFAATTLFVSHFGRKVNITKIFAGCIFLCAVCAFLYVIPHWLYGTGNDDIDNLFYIKNTIAAFGRTQNRTASDKSSSSVSYELPTQFCDSREKENELDSTNYNESSHKVCKKALMTEFSGSSFSLVAFGLFVTSEVLQGLAGTPIWSLGIEFLDNATGPKLASKLIGMMYSVRFISPTLSFILGAWFLSIYSNLDETELTQEHPRWVGAWWLGFLVCGLASLAILIPMMMLPKQMKPISKEPEIKEDPNDEETFKKSSDFKDMPKSMSRLLRNPIYLLTMLGIIVDVLMVGYVIFVPKYLEVQFQMTSAMANIFGGVVPALCGGVSSLVSGFIASKIKDTHLSRLCRFTCLFSAATIFSLFPVLLIGCHQLNLAGTISDQRLNVATTCNTNCSCTTMTFDPVCGSDNRLYYSPCHAGCSEPGSSWNMTLGPCECIDDKIAKRGMCNTDCMWSLVIFLLCFYVTVFVANIYNVPATNTMLRSVGKEDKSMAMGFLTFFMSFLVFPAPILYGKAIDSTCLIHRPTITSECNLDVTSAGACLLYDRAGFRWKLHIIFLGLKAVSTIIYIFPWVLTKKCENKKKTNNPINQASDDENK